MTITKPWQIEFPRSLVDVVVAWNIPMHQWLKCYVFQLFINNNNNRKKYRSNFNHNSKKNYYNNIFLAIFFTYFISSYLHVSTEQGIIFN